MKGLENFVVLVLTTEQISSQGKEEPGSSKKTLRGKVTYVNRSEFGYFHGIWFTIYYSKP
jgi:hypothetical protein